MSHAEQNASLETRTLYGMQNYLDSSPAAQNEMMAEVYFTFARLLYLNGMMNCDPHSNNILVTRANKSPPMFKCVIIDMQQIRKITDDGYLRLLEEYNKLLQNKTPENKIAFMKQIIDEFVSISTIYRKAMYGINNSGADWIEWYSEDEQNGQLIKAANKFLTFNAVPRHLHPDTISFLPLPPGSTRPKRPLELDLQPPAAESAALLPLAPPPVAAESSNSLKQALEPQDYKLSKRQRGGKSKRTRREKSKKRRTIKHRNALKR
jgi:hypothetical protein